MAPTVSTYASPGMSGGLVFTPDGTLWTESYNGTRSITEIAGTNAATPGANAQVQSAPVNPNGQASFTYTGVNTGTDDVLAIATINNATLASKPTYLTWGPGADVTFLSLNQSPSGGTLNQPATVVA